MKKCPYCAEEIQDEAIKCKHCGSNIQEVSKINVSSGEKTGETLGLVMLFIPICTSLFVWFWIGSMTLLEGPRSKLYLLAAITVLGTAILAAIESSKLGIGNSSDLTEEGKKKTGPVEWFIFMILVWIFAYPVYLWTRSKYGLKNYLLPGIFVAIVFIVSIAVMGSNINNKIAEIQSMSQQ